MSPVVQETAHSDAVACESGRLMRSSPPFSFIAQMSGLVRCCYSVKSKSMNPTCWGGRPPQAANTHSEVHSSSRDVKQGGIRQVQLDCLVRRRDDSVVEVEAIHRYRRGIELSRNSKMRSNVCWMATEKSNGPKGPPCWMPQTLRNSSGPVHSIGRTPCP